MSTRGFDSVVLAEGQDLPEAPAGMRYVGLCRDCKDFVELDGELASRSCAHDKGRIAMAMLLEADAELPHLPKMNWGAFLMPALWGPGHGQWYLILMYPIWLFLDNIVYTAVHAGGLYVLLAVVCLAVMLAFMVVYARGANMFGYLRVAQDKDLGQFLGRERVWAVVMGVIAVAFVVFATWYNLTVRPGL